MNEIVDRDLVGKALPADACGSDGPHTVLIDYRGDHPGRAALVERRLQKLRNIDLLVGSAPGNFHVGRHHRGRTLVRHMRRPGGVAAATSACGQSGKSGHPHCD